MSARSEIVAAAEGCLAAAGVGPPIAGGIAEWLDEGGAAAPAGGSGMPDLLPAALAAARRGPCARLAAAIEPVAPDLAWSHPYAADPWAAPFASRMATARVAEADDFACGVYVVAPDTFYPEHGHPATEVYLTLSGDPLFLGEGGWVDLAPGTASVQQPDSVHALRTRAEPAVFFWAWAGDVASPIWALDETGVRFVPAVV